MITIKALRVLPVSSGLQVVCVIARTAESVGEYEYRYERAYTPTGPWKVISPYTLGAIQCVDAQVDLKHRGRKYFYRVTARKNGKTTSCVSGHELHFPDRVALVIANKKKLVLDRRTGIPCTLYIKSTEGQRCNSCCDDTRKLRTRTNCPKCKGTGFLSGYLLYAEHILVNFEPNKDEVRRTPWLELTRQECVAEMGNSPLVTPGDVILEPPNMWAKTSPRWYVDGVYLLEKRRWPVKQMLKLKEVGLNKPEQDLELLE